MSVIKQVTAGAGADTLLNEINRALGPAALYGIKDIAGLNLSLYGSPFNGVNVTDQTVTLTASNTNYVVSNRTTGAVSVATATTNWNDQTTYMRLYQIVAGASTMTIAVDSDKRQAFGGTGGTSITTDNDTTLAGDSSTNVPTQHAVKSYVDNLVQGLSWKKAVRVASTANGTLASSFANGATIDGVTVVTGDRLLIKNQATAADNGIYIVPSSGAPARAGDADVGAELVNACVYVSEGSTLADTQWVCSTNAPITIGSTSISFVQSSAGGFTNPMTTAGDVIAGGSGGTPGRLGVGSNGQVLTVVGGLPAWATASGGSNDSTVQLGSLAKWATAKARGSTNPARFAFIGDSNVAGQGTGTGTNNLTGAASTNMARKFATLAGFQIESFFAEQNVLGASGTVNGYDPRVALGSGWAADTVPSTFGGRFLKSTAAPAGRLTFTPVAAFSKFRLWYPTASGANTAMTVYVDGTLVDTINQLGSSSFTFKDYTVTPGTHVIGIGGGATGIAYVTGIETFNGTSSPVMLQGAWCGAKVADISTTTDPWSFRNSLVAVVPDFTMVYCTINDATAKTLGNAYYASLEAVVKAVLATSGGCLCLGYPANQVATNDGYYDALATSLKNLAADYGWFFYDTRRVFGRSYARAVDKGYTFDTLHPNKTGSDAMASDLFNFLNAAGL